MRKYFWLLIGLAALLASPVNAAETNPTGHPDLTLSAIFSDNMVLQRGRPLPVWGWGADGETVRVTFRGQSRSATVRHQRWQVTFPAQKTGAPADFTVSTRGRTVRYTNVVVGEVWVCSGQSNMEWPLERSHEPVADIAAATDAGIRLFLVPKNRQPGPTTLVNSSWQVCSPEAVRKFSAVAYYFARSLRETREVPVGLIGTYWGGSPAEAWMSREALEINPRYQREILAGHPAALDKWREELGKFRAEQAAARAAGQTFNREAPRQPWSPSELYNGMIEPLVPFAIAGALWYQGESNAGRAEQYRTLFPDLIRDWRHQWGQGDFPFLCVQLAPWDRNKQRTLTEITAAPGDSDWAELREAQWLATQTLPAVGMAVITDVGDKDDIHPTRKQPVGERLARAARAIAYKENVAYRGPTVRASRVLGDAIELQFDHVGQGLEARGGSLTGFAICGADRQFVWGTAEITGRDRVVVRSPQVPAPVAVRYGWADFPVVNLWNRDGLPASPFRTDDFPLTTAPKN